MYDNLVAIAKSWGLFYLVSMSIAVVIYAWWPSNRPGFERVRQSILDKDDKPWN